MIAVVDYCKGNLKSVERGLIRAGGDARIVTDPAEIEAAEAVVLPGVGAYADASETMIGAGQMEAIKKSIAAGKPFLGICLGIHLLFECGIEDALGPGNDGEVGGENLPVGVGVLEGCAVRMPDYDAAGTFYKVPHVGWNSIEVPSASFRTQVGAAPAGTTTFEACPLLAGIQPGEYFYFTHSYISPDTNYTVATTTHSKEFPSVVQAGRVFGVQFHPEKSSDAGAKVLKNFLNIIKQTKQ